MNLMAQIKLDKPRQVAVNAAASQLPDTGNRHGVYFKAICPGQTIYIGTDNAVTTGNGFALYDGETLELDIRNCKDVWVVASADGQKLAILPFARI